MLRCWVPCVPMVPTGPASASLGARPPEGQRVARMGRVAQVRGGSVPGQRIDQDLSTFGGTNEKVEVS